MELENASADDVVARMSGVAGTRYQQLLNMIRSELQPSDQRRMVLALLDSSTAWRPAGKEGLDEIAKLLARVDAVGPVARIHAQHEVDRHLAAGHIVPGRTSGVHVTLSRAEGPKVAELRQVSINAINQPVASQVGGFVLSGLLARVRTWFLK